MLESRYLPLPSESCPIKGWLGAASSMTPTPLHESVTLHDIQQKDQSYKTLILKLTLRFIK
jgi:hypothetical protein